MLLFMQIQQDIKEALFFLVPEPVRIFFLPLLIIMMLRIQLRKMALIKAKVFTIYRGHRHVVVVRLQMADVAATIIITVVAVEQIWYKAEMVEEIQALLVVREII